MLHERLVELKDWDGLESWLVNKGPIGFASRDEELQRVRKREDANNWPCLVVCLFVCP